MGYLSLGSDDWQVSIAVATIFVDACSKLDHEKDARLCKTVLPSSTVMF